MNTSKPKQQCIQFWEALEVPQYLRDHLPPMHNFEWVALIPSELNNDLILTLLTNGNGQQGASWRRPLAEGGLLLAGYSVSTKPSAFQQSAISSFFGAQGGWQSPSAHVKG